MAEALQRSILTPEDLAQEATTPAAALAEGAAAAAVEGEGEGKAGREGGASGLRRKHTMAKFGKGKARGDVTTNALLEVALAALLNNVNVVAENVSNEVSCW